MLVEARCTVQFVGRHVVPKQATLTVTRGKEKNERRETDTTFVYNYNYRGNCSRNSFSGTTTVAGVSENHSEPFYMKQLM